MIHLTLLFLRDLFWPTEDTLADLYAELDANTGFGVSDS